MTNFRKITYCDKYPQVAASIEPVLKVKHFEELVLASQDARNRLQDLGCFSDVEIHIDTSKDGGKSDYEVMSYSYCNGQTHRLKLLFIGAMISYKLAISCSR